MRIPTLLPRAAALLALAALPAAAQPAVRGFPADAIGARHGLEQRARAVPSRDSLRARLRLLSEDPHEAGTDRSRRVAELIVARFRAAGLAADIERFEALMPRPVSRTLEMVAPVRWTAQLRETPVEGDKDSGDADQLPTYNAYSPDGDVTAELVFVNYGLPDDYRVLDSLGIDVRGKIVIAKYGRSWRGIKPKLAAEHGAVACLIYSDPRDDGYWHDDVYPKGPMRPPQGVQRGSVMDMPTHPGDPLSPGWGSVPGARKLAIAETRVIEPIPVLPISYGDAQPLLERLAGPVAPEPWRGALPITYHVGPGPARVHLALKFDWQTRPLYNAVARIPGAVWPDQMVVHGNHHDAWVNGANDPLSGMVAVEETARSLGALLRTGWRPARTIVLVGWDGEEWGLLGSTEWAEQNQDALRRGLVAYLNSDTNDRGWINVGGSHTLQTFATELARDVADPKTGKSVLQYWLDRPGRRAALQRADTMMVEGERQPAPRADSAKTDSARARIAADARARAAGLPPRVDTVFAIEALGSGSDYTAFLDFIGAPSMNISYGGESRDGIYHSVYDSFAHYTRFKDTSFAYGVAESQTMTTALLRLADAPVLPFEFTNAARTFRQYADEIEKAARTKPETRSLNLTAVREAIGRLDAAAARWERVATRVEGASSAALRRRARELAAVNQALYTSEQALTDSAGLPGRQWFRHLLYAPGFYTGYGVKTMPGIREAVEDRPNGAIAQREAARVAAAIDRMTARVTEAAAGLEAILR